MHDTPVVQPDRDGGVFAILEDTIGDLTANWMYTALVEGVFDGPQPAWSKDSWSFVPPDLSKIPSLKTKGQSKGNNEGLSFADHYPTANLTFETTAIRGGIECSHIQESADPRQWLSIISNTTFLREQGLTDNDTMFLTNKTMFPGTDYCTTLISGIAAPGCCTNGSITTDSKQHPSPVALGYWTMNFPSDLNVNQSALYRKSGNFTIKWVTGMADRYKFYEGLDWNLNNTLYFTKRPEIQALNCRPKIESATALVTVDHVQSQVQHYQILSGAQPEDVAWSDSFELRNLTLDGFCDDGCTWSNRSNVTIRYAPLDVSVSSHRSFETATDIYLSTLSCAPVVRNFGQKLQIMLTYYCHHHYNLNQFKHLGHTV
jgi:hypothetical protein